MDGGTTSNGFYLTLGAAAKQAGLAKSTLSRAIKDGKLSAQRCPETNSFRVDPAELQRFLDAVRIVRAEQPATPVPNTESVLATQVQLLEARLVDLKTMLDDVRADRDQWREQASAALRLLPGPKPERRGLWRWLKRAG